MIIDVNGMPPYKTDSSFRNAAIASFTFYKRIFGNEYKQIINIRKESGCNKWKRCEMNRIVVKHIKEKKKNMTKHFTMHRKILLRKII
jgi:hypothetical protein